MITSMLMTLFVGGIGMLTCIVLFATTGLLPHDKEWWFVMVPASWAFTGLYHYFLRRN